MEDLLRVALTVCNRGKCKLFSTFISFASRTYHLTRTRLGGQNLPPPVFSRITPKIVADIDTKLGVLYPTSI